MPLSRLLLLCLLLLTLPLQGLASVMLVTGCAHRVGGPVQTGFMASPATGDSVHAGHVHDSMRGGCAPLEHADHGTGQLLGADALSGCALGEALDGPCDPAEGAGCQHCAACVVAAAPPATPGAWAADGPPSAPQADVSVMPPSTATSQLERPPRSLAG